MRMISKSQLYCTTMEFNAPLFTRKNQNCTTMEFSASLFTGKNQKMGLYACTCVLKRRKNPLSIDVFLLLTGVGR